MSFNIEQTNKKRLVIVGGGFAGIKLAKRLSNKPIQVVLIDRHNYHTFQPLLYQVATGGLEPDSIAYPLRRIFRKANNIFFRMAEVTKVNPEESTIYTNIGSLSYDFLVLATGSTTNFHSFGDSNHLLMPLKTIPDALNLRSFLLQNFEDALLATDLKEREGLINVAIAGGGPTGVELAGALGEMKKYVLPRDYPELDFKKMKIHLFESAPRLLAALSEESSARAYKYLSDIDIQIWLKTPVQSYDGFNLTLYSGQVLQAETLIWTAGVKVNSPEGIPASAILPGGRLKVDSFNLVDGLSNVYAIGDIAGMISNDHPKGHPMLAPVAIQQALHLAMNIQRLLTGKSPIVFNYKDRGTMATVGRNRAVVELKTMKFYGTLAWYIWMFVHIMSLVGFRNRIAVFFNWLYNYFTYDRALRLIIRPFQRKQ
jgi:NADH dehydrogenase